MLKFAKYFSIATQPLFVAFCNLLFLLLLTGKKGAVLGFDITLFFLSIVILPLFYTAAALYSDNKEFQWSHISEMVVNSRRKILVYTIFYSVIILLILLSLNVIFLGDFKPMFASVVMGFVFSLMLAFLLNLAKNSSSLHTLVIALFMCFGFIFSWEVPGINGLANPNYLAYLILGIVNAVILIGAVWAKLFTKTQSVTEVIFGIIIGILSPIVLTLLTYGI